MALTRKMLKAMGIEDEKIDQIIEAHSETVDGLKDKLKAAEEKAEKLADVEKQLGDLKAKGEDGYKDKYDKVKKEFDEYKSSVTARDLKAAKEKAVRQYFEGKNITGANLDIAMRGCRDEINAIVLDGDKIKDTAALDALVSGTFSGLIVSKTVRGAETATPPANGGGSKLTRAEIFKKDDKGHYVMSTAERQKALAENPDAMKG